MTSTQVSIKKQSFVKVCRERDVMRWKVAYKTAKDRPIMKPREENDGIKNSERQTYNEAERRKW